MSAAGLTPKADELLRYIEQRMSDGRVAPSFEEMKVACGFASKSGVHRLLSQLEDRGYIKRRSYRHRDLTLTAPSEIEHISTNRLIVELERRGLHTSALVAMRELATAATPSKAA